jgi:hypothetical protein
MANYIHNTNQTLLWNAVNKIPEFQKLSPPKKDFEFKQIIEMFYRKISDKPYLSTQELQNINRETLLAFIPKQYQTSYSKPPLHPQTQPNPVKFFETKQELSQRQFEERQNIYKQMNSKPELPSPEIFKEKDEDSKIENMDVLIQHYQQQRDIEFQQFIPNPPISINPTPTPNINPTTKANPRMRILEDVTEREKEKLFMDVDRENKIEIKKNVSWSSISNQEYTIEDYWENKISKLEQRIFLLEEQLIKTEVYISLEKVINQVI